MRILVISAAFPPMAAGEADHVYHLAENLALRGFDVHVLTSKSNAGVKGNGRAKIHPIMAGWSWRDAPRLIGFLRRCSPDAVLLYYIGWIYQYHPMITFAATMVKRRKPAVRFVTEFANAEGAEPQRFSLYTRLVRRVVGSWAGEKGTDYYFGTLLRDSDRVIVLSGIHLNRLPKLPENAKHKSILIPPPPIIKMCPQENDIRQRMRKRFALSDEMFLFVYFGYVYPGKGVETLLTAFKDVLRKHSNSRLLVLGGFIARNFPGRSNYADEIRSMPKQLGIEDKVIWVGEYASDSDEASSSLRAADACVLPVEIGIQLNNSSLAGAVAHSLPIIATRGTVVEEAFVDGHNVLLCPPKNPAGLAEAMNCVIERPELRARLKEGACVLARDYFSWDLAISRTVRAIGADV